MSMAPPPQGRRSMGGGFKAHAPSGAHHAGGPEVVQGKGIAGAGLGPAPAHDPAQQRRAAGPAARKDAGRAGGEPPVKAEVEAAKIEREYIDNLQQQICFLELELKYLREQPAQPPPEQQQQQQQARQRDDHGNISMEDLDGAQLGSVVQSLRRKVHHVQQLHAKSEQDKDRLQQDLEAKLKAEGDQVALLEKQNAALHSKVTELAEKLRQSWNPEVAADPEKREAESNMKRLQEELALITQERDVHIEKEQDAIQKAASMEADVERLKTESAKVRHRAESAEEQVRRLELELEDLRKEAAANAGSLSAEQEKKLQADLHRVLSDLETHVIRIRRLEEEKVGREKLLLEIKSSLTTAQERASTLEQRLESELGHLAKHDSGTRITQLEGELSLAKEGLKSAEREASAARAAEIRAREVRSEVQQKLLEADSDLKIKEALVEELKASLAQAQDTLNTMASEKEKEGDETGKLRMDLALASRDAQEAQQALAHMRAEFHRAKVENEMNRVSVALNGEGLSSLAEANQQVSKSISSLISNIKAVSDA